MCVRVPPNCDGFKLDKHKYICNNLIGIVKSMSNTRSGKGMPLAIEKSLALLETKGVALSYFHGSSEEWYWKDSDKYKKVLIERKKEAESRKKNAATKQRNQHHRTTRPPHHRKLSTTDIDQQRRLHVYYLVDRVLPMHIASQMHLLNIHPPKHLYNPNNDPSVNEISALIRVERFDEGLQALKSTIPDVFGSIRPIIEHRNKNEGGINTEEVRFPCSLAWKMYDYFIQDFVCLGYELPDECLKEECKSREV